MQHAQLIWYVIHSLCFFAALIGKSQAQLNPDLSSYSNSISVLKYPYDGSKPDRY